MTQSIIGQCAECCDCPPAILRTAARSYGESKCGFSDSLGETPLKRFLKKTDCYGGQKRVSIYTAPDCELTSVDSCSVWCAAFIDPDDGRRYAVRTTVTTASGSINGECSGPGPSDFRSDFEWSYTSTETSRISCSGGEIVTDVSYAGSSTSARTLYVCPPDHAIVTDNCDATQNSDGSWSGTRVYNGVSSSITSPCPTFEAPETVVTTYSEEVTDPDYPLYENEYTTDQLIAYLLAGLAAGSYGSYTGSTSVTSALLTYIAVAEDELSAAAYQSKYRFRHKASKVGSGCYRILWDQAYVPKCGLALGSLESLSPLGGYEPGEEVEVIISEPNVGGCDDADQAVATAIANAEGVLEFTLTTPGMGYGADVTVTVDGYSLIVHLAGADALEYEWDKITPGGYDPDDQSTWPESPEIEAELPEGVTADTVGEVWLMNIRSTCRGCA